MIEIYRDALFYGKLPEINILVPFLIFSVVLFVTQYMVFPENENRVW